MGVTTAVIALAIAGTLTWKRKLPKIVALLALVAGAGLTSGWVGNTLHSCVGALADLVGSFTSSAFGVAVPAVIAVVGLIIFVHDIWPRHSASRLTAGVGLVLPVLLTYLGGVAGSAAGSVIDGISSAASSALTALFGGGS